MSKLQNMRRKAVEQGKKLGLAGAALVAFVNNALAAVPTDVTTALTDMKADALTVGGAFVVAVIALKALKLMKRA